MLPGLPAYINITFILTALGALVWFSILVKKRAITFLVMAWLLLQGMLAQSGFYANTRARPPHIVLAVLPALVAVILVMASKRGRSFAATLDARGLVWLSVVRIPVELVLYWLYQNHTIPKQMTFAGRNFDLLAGLSAPLIALYCFKSGRIIHRVTLSLWNILALGLLLNIMVNAFISLPTEYQQFGLQEPNRAVLYFPFIWLPSFIVMIVLLSHLILFKKLILSNHQNFLGKH